MESNISIIPSELTSVCVQLIIEASKIISSIKTQASVDYKLKGEKDPLTEADLTAQSFIIKGLRRFWPDVKIIGEEDQLPKDEWKYDFANLNKKLIPDEFFYDPSGLKIPDIPNNNSIIWLDPLDGTLDYVQGDIEYVTTLIGVSSNKQPILGLIGHLYSERVYFSHPGTKKIYYLPFDLSTKPQEVKIEEKKDKKLTLVVTKNRMTDKLKADLEKISDKNLLQMGGCGKKIMSVIFNEADAYYSNTINKMKKWDICAGEALLRAIGGKMTDFDGNDYEYTEDQVTNSKGLLVTKNEAIQKLILEQLKKSIV